ncbi:MAG: hypothetical protein QN122_09750 [Armatimonadota bacterium]|nr:hypothetical protein [Armatimonadota bacterium]MDR7447921.1 hypothetical protein [Armatimonadota bacterium]MDR7458184.1 hypothetical protein [Armatimonadota bacterium]MDR7478510.1 hypothetical protein [Armatimonadota bacterium]MDR7487677.1 hypothetical protein [Armatimonadota bacterium]
MAGHALPEKRQPDALEDHAFGRLGGVHLDRGRELLAQPRPQRLLEMLEPFAPPRQEHEFATQCGQRDPLTSQVVCRRADQDDRILQDQPAGEVLVVRSSDHEPYMNGSVEHHPGDIAGMAGAHRHAHLRVACVEPVEEGREHVEADRDHRAHGQGLSRRPSPHRGETALNGSQAPLDVCDQFSTGGCQFHSSSAASEQAMPDLPFQGLDLGRHGRLGEEQGGGRSRHAPLLRHPAKRPEALQVERPTGGNGHQVK